MSRFDVEAEIPAAPPTGDAALVLRAQRGDTAALGQLYDRHAPLLRALALRRLRNAAHADDLVHDVFIEAFRTIRRFDPDRGSVRAWLATLLRSRAIDRYRALGRREQPTADGEIDRTDPGPTPDQSVERPWIRSLVDALNPIYRDALVMTYFEGRTLAECADGLGVPVGTVKARVSRAVAQLRQRLREDES